MFLSLQMCLIIERIKGMHENKRKFIMVDIFEVHVSQPVTHSFIKLK